jgi:hypothetical protein
MLLNATRKLKKEAMKTRNFTLYAAVLMMATGLTAAGQPERGERNGNHENNNRREMKSATPAEKRENVNSSADPQKKERVTTGNGIHTADNPTLRRESVNTGRRMETRENRGENNRQKEYTYNRDNKESPSPNYRENNRNLWGNRNYSRHEWEQRQYNWNDHHWDFSNYYRKGTVPYYFRNNNHYWYYPEYGHILRGFRHEPVIFYSGRMPYYFEDGFFYRYYSGIGYVWIEEPYDIWFNELPYGAVRVRIGGRMYFRLGNAYFMLGHAGFHLVVLADRFYDRDYDRGVSFEVSARF